MSNMIPNIRRALTGKELSGPKVRAFYANITGDYKQVTIDVWMIRFFNADYILTPKRYKKLEQRIVNYAHGLGMEPAELQAIAWNYQRAKDGFKPVDFVGVAEENQLKLF